MGASKVRPVVLEIIQEFGPLTHDELIGKYHERIIRDPETPTASDSGIRTRLKELKSAGLVRVSDEKGVSTFGNPAKMWEVVDPDDVVVLPDPPDAAFGDEDVIDFTLINKKA